jgi:anti-sigma regulatory factor (Ser/Thr protein kinase)
MPEEAIRTEALTASQTLEFRLTRRPDAASRARAELGRFDFELEQESETVRLLLTELVTNSIRHARETASPIEVQVRADPGGVRVEVDDSGQGFEPRPVAPGIDGGFGLLLIDRLADRWGVLEERPCRVWFELDRN